MWYARAHHSRWECQLNSLSTEIGDDVHLDARQCLCPLSLGSILATTPLVRLAQADDKVASEHLPKSHGPRVASGAEGGQTKVVQFVELDKDARLWLTHLPFHHQGHLGSIGRGRSA